MVLPTQKLLTIICSTGFLLYWDKDNFFLLFLKGPKLIRFVLLRMVGLIVQRIRSITGLNKAFPGEAISYHLFIFIPIRMVTCLLICQMLKKRNTISSFTKKTKPCCLN